MKHYIFLVLFSWMYCNGFTQITSIHQLENKVLPDILKLTPGLMIDEKVLEIYLDEHMNKTSPGNEKYKVEAKFHSSNYVIKGVATYDDGYVQQANKQELKNYTLTGYYDTGELAFTILSLYAKSVPNSFMFDGVAVWYRKDGSLLAKGTFDGGQLVGEYVEYDDFGEVKTTAHFDAESKLMNFDEYKNLADSPIIGDWVQETKEDMFGDFIVEALHNEYLQDGTLKIYNCAYNLYNGQSQPDEVYCDEVYLLHYKYKPKSDNRGIVEIYKNGQLIEKEMVSFITENEFKSKTVFSGNDPNAIGTSFHFKLNTVK